MCQPCILAFIFTGQKQDIFWTQHGQCGKISKNKQKGVKKLLPSKLDLIGRDLEDINREFQVLLVKIQSGLPQTEDKKLQKQIVDSWNGDINGWINWLNSLKK